MDGNSKSSIYRWNFHGNTLDLAIGVPPFVESSISSMFSTIDIGYDAPRYDFKAAFLARLETQTI